MAAHNAVILKAESMSDKTEWVTKIKRIVDPKGLAAKKPNASEGGASMRQSHSDGSLVCCKTLQVCFVNRICNACIWFCQGWIMWHLLFIPVKRFFPFTHMLYPSRKQYSRNLWTLKKSLDGYPRKSVDMWKQSSIVLQQMSPS